MADAPSKVYAGDSLSWTLVQPDYPASDGWILTVYFAVGTAEPVPVAATASGTDHLLTVPPDTTSGWAAGTCHWTARVAKAGETHTVDQGLFQVLPDPTVAADRRTHAEKCLAAITAVLEDRMGDPIVEYEIDGTKAKKLPHAELIKLRAHYLAVVRRQKGGSVFRQFPVRFLP